jgi:uncharacterized delta-60 repeat protein
LDPDFGVDGAVISRIDGRNTWVSDMALQPDGKILLGANTDPNAFSRDFNLLRFNPDGSLDTSFGSGGTASTEIGNHGDDSLHAIALQPDGKIIAAGDTYTVPQDLDWDRDFALVRFNPDGSLDTSFDSDGILTTTINTRDGDVVNSVAVQPDGKIVAAGDTYLSWNSSDFALARYNPDGSLDTSFDGDGIVITNYKQYDHISDLAIQPDGKLVVAGYAGTHNYDDDCALVRYNSDGSLDTSFGSGGFVTINFSEADNDYGNSLALQEDGKIVVAGVSNDTGFTIFVLARLNPNGSLEKTAGVRYDEEDNSASAVAIEPSGNIIALGSIDKKFGLARFNPDFKLDTSFSDDGILTTSIGDESGGVAIVVLSDGKLLVAGNTSISNGAYFVIARYK